MNEEVVVNPHIRGKKFELKIIKFLKELGYSKLGRTILMNKDSDNKGIDIEARTEGKIPINVQAKASSKRVKYDLILTNMARNGAVNVIFHEYWWKGTLANSYAVLTIEDFQRLLDKEQYGSMEGHS